MTTARELYTYLNGLTAPEVLASTSYIGLRDAIVNTLSQQLPDWVNDPAVPLYKASENYAFRLFVGREDLNSTFLQGLIRYATGTNLDHIVILAGVTRQTGEQDEALRQRYFESVAGFSVGTLDAFVKDTKAVYPDASDVVPIAVGSLTGSTVSVYVLGPEGVALDQAQRALIATYLNGSSRIHVGDVAEVPATTETAYTIEGTYRYDSREDDIVELAARVRASVYDFIDAIRGVGRAVYVSAIENSIFVEGVLDASVTVPGSDVDGVEGAVPVCPKTEVAVILTSSDIVP